jgi:hypothetical protein
LPDEPAFLLTHQQHQHRVALAPRFTVFSRANGAVSSEKLKAAPANKRTHAKTTAFVMMELRRAGLTSKIQQTSAQVRFPIFIRRNSPHQRLAEIFALLNFFADIR